MTFNMGAAIRDRENRLQGDGYGFQDQGIRGRPEINLLAIGQLNPAQQPEAVAPGQEV